MSRPLRLNTDLWQVEVKVMFVPFITRKSKSFKIFKMDRRVLDGGLSEGRKWLEGTEELGSARFHEINAQV